MRDKRASIVAMAAEEIGHPGHPRIMEYHDSAIGRRVGSKELEWCGLFCLAMLHKAGFALDVHWTIGGGFCEEQHLPKTRDPQPGDVAYFAVPFQHHALVEMVRGDDVHTIDGNQVGDAVTRRRRDRSKATCYYSIQPLLDAVPELPEAGFLRDGPFSVPGIQDKESSDGT